MPNLSDPASFNPNQVVARNRSDAREGPLAQTGSTS
jgi:hypothetical protein